MSDAGTASRPEACSGEMYCAVPITRPVRVTGTWWATLAMPKSVIFTLAAGSDQQVARLDVAVHQRAGVRDLQRAAGLVEHVEGAAGGQPALPGEDADSGSPATSSITR